MNTQNILNSRGVKDCLKIRLAQDSLHELGVPRDSTYSPEAQLLEDPWEIKENFKRERESARQMEDLKKRKEKRKTTIKKVNPKTIVPILWADKTDSPQSPTTLSDGRGSYSLPVKLKSHPKRLKENEKMRQIYLNGEPLRKRVNAFALMKIFGKVCYIGRCGGGPFGIWECHDQDSEKFGIKKNFEITGEIVEHVRNM
jgi:hypothetical protein